MIRIQAPLEIKVNINLDQIIYKQIFKKESNKSFLSSNSLISIILTMLGFSLDSPWKQSQISLPDTNFLKMTSIGEIIQKYFNSTVSPTMHLIKV